MSEGGVDFEITEEDLPVLDDLPQYIDITERDMAVEDDHFACIDLERNIWVRFGVPIDPDTSVISRESFRNLKGPPYVFQADLFLRDNNHPEGVELKDQTVIFMHGGRKEDGPWTFSSFEDGYPVVETVRAVNQYLQEQGKNPISVVMACNRDPTNSNIKVGDFDRNEGMVYAVGESIKFRGLSMEENGKVHFMAKADDFWGLDDAMTEQEIVFHD